MNRSNGENLSVVSDRTRDVPFSDAAPLREDPVAPGPADSITQMRAKCGVCLRCMPLRRDGAIRVHGPVSHRCPGSGNLPLSNLHSQSSAVPIDIPCPTSNQSNSTSSTSSTDSDAGIWLQPCGRILKRVPRGSRELAANKLADILTDVTLCNDVKAWKRLLEFPRKCLRVPKRGGHRWSLVRQVNALLSEECDHRDSSINVSFASRNLGCDLQSLASRVSAKLDEGNFKSAVRLVCSEDSLAEVNDATIAALRAKHPEPHPETCLPLPPDNLEMERALSVREGDVVHAICSFPKGSAGGLDGLRPQHLLDLTSKSAGCGRDNLLRALTAFTNFVLSGKITAEVRSTFFGASLIALNKIDGGVRPIAVGCTLRRLVAKVGSRAVMHRMGLLLAPIQLGFGTPLGAEAAVHSARIYLSNLQPDQVLFKLDFKNAFNSIRRDKVLEAARQFIPELFPYVHSCYSSPSFLRFHDCTLLSAEGVQQGDPLGPLLFCLTILPLTQQLKSEFCVFYLDDGTLGGNESDVLHDFQVIDREAATLGLHLNHRKSEGICEDPAGRTLLKAATDLCRVSCEAATLLGSPIGERCGIDVFISDKLKSLKTMGSRLHYLQKHDALCLLRHSLAIPKILYILRTASCFSSSYLDSFDLELRSILSNVLNISLDNDSAWTQATLPVRYGGIGVRSVVHLAPSAFLASAAGSSDLIRRILPVRFEAIPYSAVESAKSVWCRGHDQEPPSHPDVKRQKAWDTPRVQSCYASLLDNATDSRSRARLLAAAVAESGAWLHALPVSSIGLRMNDEVVRIAVGLRLGVPLCHSHQCCLCGQEVDELATHGLSCAKSPGRHSRHAAINSIIKRSLATAQIPSTLEPVGLCRSDGKRPDGVTIAPWRGGRTLVWDATCPDTYASSYVAQATSRAGAVAELAERRKKDKYACIAATHHFIPVTIETSGVFGPEAEILFSDIARRIRDINHEPATRAFLLQQVSVAIQRGNAAAMLGTMPRN